MNNFNLLPPPNGTDTIVLLDIQYLKKKSTIVIKEISALFSENSNELVKEYGQMLYYLNGYCKEIMSLEIV